MDERQAAMEAMAAEILRPKKPCGSCTLCCKVVPVKEIEKPANQWCQHCDQTKGCKIYDTRPGSCRMWSCAWVLDENLPAFLEPKKCHFVIDCLPDECAMLENGKQVMKQVVQMWVDPGYPNAWQEPAARWAMEFYGLNFQLPTLVRFGNEKGIFVMPSILSPDNKWHYAMSGVSLDRESFNAEFKDTPRNYVP